MRPTRLLAVTVSLRRRSFRRNVRVVNSRGEWVAMDRGATITELTVEVLLITPGSATLRATLGDAVGETTVVVRPRPAGIAALVVDSFSVAEYRPGCAWACPYLLYAPLLKPREPSGERAVTLISVRFFLPPFGDLECRGTLVFGPPQASHANGMHECPWSNDLIWARLDGQPVADAEASAKFMTRDAFGGEHTFRVTGPIRRMVPFRVLPRPDLAKTSTNCG